MFFAMLLALLRIFSAEVVRRDEHLLDGPDCDFGEVLFVAPSALDSSALLEYRTLFHAG